MGVYVFFVLGTVSTGATGQMKLQMSADNGVTDPFTDVAGTGILYTATNTLQGAVVDLNRPQKRYVQAVVVRGAGGNTVIAAITALSYHDNIAPNVPGGTSTTGNIINVIWLNNAANGARRNEEDTWHLSHRVTQRLAAE